MGVSDITGASDLCHPPPPYASNRDGPRLQLVPARLWTPGCRFADCGGVNDQREPAGSLWSEIERRDQRVAIYIVTSKPKRRSVAAGVVQAMI